MNKKPTPISNDLVKGGMSILEDGNSRVRIANNTEREGITKNNIVAKLSFLIEGEEDKDIFNKRDVKNIFKAKYPAVNKLQLVFSDPTSKIPVIPRIKSFIRKILATGIIIAKKRK